MQVITSVEGLWRSCAALASIPNVLRSELDPNHREHLTLAYGPVAQRNRFQAMLYSEHHTFNISLLPIHHLELFGKIPWPGKLVCHFHWIHGEVAQAKTVEEANEAVKRWKRLIERLKEDGRKIVWTVHNILPHESIWPEHDIKVRKVLANMADLVHIMAKDTEAQVRPYYTLHSDKVVYIPHPLYSLDKKCEVKRTKLRQRYMIDDDELVLLTFGAIMKYKGYERLLAAYNNLHKRTHRRTRIIIAGVPTDESLVFFINTWAQGKSNVILDLSPVPDETLDEYFQISDLVVCPYLRTLNSGVAMMALTFGVPVLGPNMGVFKDLYNAGFGRTFESGQDESLLDELVLSIKSLSKWEINNDDVYRSFSPEIISQQLLTKIAEL